MWRLAAVYFGIVFGFYGISFWLPQIVQAFGGLDELEIGLVSAVPYVAAALAMVWVGRSSDRSGERRWHVAAPALVGALREALDSTDAARRRARERVLKEFPVGRRELELVGVVRELLRASGGRGS